MLTFQTQQEPIENDLVALLVCVNGSFDRVSVKHFEKQFEDYLKIGYKFVILDCSGIKFVNSSGLQLMLKIVEEYREQGGIFLFLSVLPQISKFFDMLGFTPIMTSFTTKEESLQYLKDQIKRHGLTDKKSETSSLPKVSANPSSKKVMGNPLSQPQQPSSTQRPYSSTRKITSSNPYENPKPQPNLPVAASNPVPPITKKMPVLVATNLEVDFSLEYYKKMMPWRVFPVNLQFKEIKNNRAKDQTLYIVPYFPGCTVVPPYRSMLAKEGNQCTFWVTPQTSQKIKPWIEIGRPQETAQTFDLQVKMGSYSFAKMLFFLAFLVLGMQYITTWFSEPRLLNFLSAIPLDLIPWEYLGHILAGFVFFLGCVFYGKNIPCKAKALQRTWQMEGLESGSVSVTQ